MHAMGIDIGTTTISVVMLDGDSGKLMGSKTVPSKAFLENAEKWERVQDPEKIWNLTCGIIQELVDMYGVPDSIGMTGQMHGILYVDESGCAVSPLYTWQDGSGNQILENEKTAAQFLRDKGLNAASGYGLTTHCYLTKTGRVPERAVSMTTISDYIAMKLCGLTKPFIATDMAASWGCYDLEENVFLAEKIEEAGMNASMLPRLCREHEIVGRVCSGPAKDVPVMVSLGDNQASFLGSVNDLGSTVLINIGTGSQVSYTTDHYFKAEGSVELRPCSGAGYLMAGCGLCGGRAYAMLENFYRMLLAGVNADGDVSESLMYAVMEKQAEDFLKQMGSDEAWKIRTTFSGTRNDPASRGSMDGIGTDNFTPGGMTLGMIMGIVRELHEMYVEMCERTGTKAASLIGSGNAVRRNPVLRKIAQDMFGMDMQVPECQEEAAYGAAMHSLVSAGFSDSLAEMQKKIHYM